MKKIYKFDHNILDFVEIRLSWSHYLPRIILTAFSALVFLSIYYLIFSFFFDTAEEQNLMRVKDALSDNYTAVAKRSTQLDKVIADLQVRDANIHRYIFNIVPSNNIDDYNDNLLENVEKMSNTTMISNSNKITGNLQKIARQQTDLLKNIMETNKGRMLDDTPTIQPVENRDLRYIAATYGMRMHPFYKVIKMHTGVDFAAPLGTNVYATATGKVVKVEKLYRKTGLSVVIDHNNGYQTHYYHLNEVNVSLNQKVNKGQVIGTIGNTGRSMAPHLHYEVWKDGKPCNPIHYFFASITPTDYHHLKIIASNKGQSLD